MGRDSDGDALARACRRRGAARSGRSCSWRSGSRSRSSAPSGGNIDAAANAFTYVLLALGLNIVVGFAGLLDLGYAAFFAIGAYTYGVAASGQLKPDWSAFWAPFLWLGQVAAGAGRGRRRPGPVPLLVLADAGRSAALICALFGVLFGAPTLRLRGDYLAIVTLGFGEIVPVVARNWDWLTNGAQGLGGIRTPKLFGFDFGFSPLPVLLPRPRPGGGRRCSSPSGSRSRASGARGWRSARTSSRPARWASTTSTTSCSPSRSARRSAGWPATFYVAKLTTATPEMFQFPVSVMILVMVVLGGMGSVRGVVLAALLLAFLQSVILQELTELGARARPGSSGAPSSRRSSSSPSLELIFGLILVLMMLFRREGLWPAVRRVAALTREQQTAAAEPRGARSSSRGRRPGRRARRRGRCSRSRG